MKDVPCFQLVPWALAAVTTGYAIYLTYKNSNKTDSDSECCRLNKSIEMDSPKVVHSFEVDDLGQRTCYCRCWASKKFPYCDGSHNEHNKKTGDNVGPLVIQRSSK